MTLNQKWVVSSESGNLTTELVWLQKEYPLLSYALRYWRVHVELPLREFLDTRCFSKLHRSKFDLDSKPEAPSAWIAGNQIGVKALVRIDRGADGTEVWKVLSLAFFYLLALTLSVDGNEQKC
jgi:hypothetical protein